MHGVLSNPVLVAQVVRRCLCGRAAIHSAHNRDSTRILIPHESYQPYGLQVRFVGSRFHGYQVNPTHPTIEGALQEAVKAAGFAAWKGAHVKGKNAWSASSRTDSRVHAARLLVVAPLNVTGDERKAKDSLNANLPPDIRVPCELSAPTRTSAPSQYSVRIRMNPIWCR